MQLGNLETTAEPGSATSNSGSGSQGWGWAAPPAWIQECLVAAFAKGKGKGKKGGGGGSPFRPASGVKGGGKGGAGGGKGGAGGGGKGGFTGTCYFCGEPGHRRSECAKYTAHLKGGGASPDSLNQVGWEYGAGGLLE